VWLWTCFVLLTEERGKLLIIILYRDDIVFTRNCEKIVIKVVNEVWVEYECLKKIEIGVEVWQSSEGIYVSQRKLAREVIEKFSIHIPNYFVSLFFN